MHYSDILGVTSQNPGRLWVYANSLVQTVLLPHLVQNIFAENGSKRDICPRKVGRVDKRVVYGSGYNELRCSKEGSKVAVEVVLLLASLATGRRPQLHRVGRNAHVHQATRASCYHYETPQNDH